MRVADTSLLYALFSEGDVHHDEAVRMMTDPETVLVPTEIWSETISLIHNRQGFNAAAMAGEDLMSLPHVEFLPSRFDMIRETWAIYLKGMGSLSLADSTVLSWCKVKNASPLTFDMEIIKHHGPDSPAKKK
jgi:predicted nucleic acid-binding protein